MGGLTRVFVVEDSPLLLERITGDIVALGSFEVVGHAGAQESAVQAISNLRPDLVVTDLQLETGSGIEVLRRVRVEHPNPPPKIFVLTNYAMPEYKLRCLTYGANAFFDKTAEYDKFLTKMEETAHCQACPANIADGTN